MVKLQPPDPEHAPPQPVSVDPPVGVAVSDISVPDRLNAVHVPLVLPALIVQLIPLPVTVPWPVPYPVTVKGSLITGAAKFADTPGVLALMVKLQPPDPEHAPPHPVNVEPPVGVAVSDTGVPDA
jgi:hypothetical protein